MARTPRPAQGEIGRCFSPVTEKIAWPALVGANLSIRLCQTGLLTNAATIGLS
jgi:hypothetical protein